jgi:hypothetical protein
MKTKKKRKTPIEPRMSKIRMQKIMTEDKALFTADTTSSWHMSPTHIGPHTQ